MPSIAALVLALAASGTSDSILTDGFDSIDFCRAPPLTRLATSNITYGVSQFPTRSAVNVTEWDNIWGHVNTTDAVVSWPGRSGSGPRLRDFTRTSFLAAHFKTPPLVSGMTVSQGFFTYPSFAAGENIDMAVSTTCGDFYPNETDSGCSVTNVASADNRVTGWKFTPGNTGVNCVLLPNTDYYLNIRLTDPDASTECPEGSNVCPLSMVHQYNGSF